MNMEKQCGVRLGSLQSSKDYKEIESIETTKINQMSKNDSSDCDDLHKESQDQEPFKLKFKARNTKPRN